MKKAIALAVLALSSASFVQAEVPFGPPPAKARINAKLGSAPPGWIWSTLPQYGMTYRATPEQACIDAIAHRNANPTDNYVWTFERVDPVPGYANRRLCMAKKNHPYDPELVRQFTTVNYWK